VYDAAARLTTHAPGATKTGAPSQKDLPVYPATTVFVLANLTIGDVRAVSEELADDFGWFTAWVGQHLGVGITLARGLSLEQMVEGLGLLPGDAVEETFDEAGSDPSRPKVRVGKLDGWAYAVEQFTVTGAAPGTLGRLSVAGGEALSLEYTQTIDTFMYAADGVVVNGFDLTVPHIRYSSDPHRFDTRMEQAGCLRPGVPDPPAMGAHFLQLTFGITIDQHMLERALPSFELI